MADIASVTLEVDDTAAARHFYSTAFGLDSQVRLRAAREPTTGFRGFTLSLVVSQPADAKGFYDAALDAGATSLKPAAKSLWGYGGVVRAPDGTVWQLATSSKKDTGPARREIDDIVLLLGVADVAATKRFYVGRGMTVGKSFGRTYVEFESGDDPVKPVPVPAPRPGQGRRRPGRGRRITPDRAQRRHRSLHRPRRVHLGARVPVRRVLKGRQSTRAGFHGPGRVSDETGRR
ncbi:VOC family protein [Nocardiopsis aegyptia]|uniref:Putative glyoxalase superfamily protein PhnB n=1 Tax=Nocardiopsis aegyptia TaxID=220378 RepID=A0A7Z0ET44_9ACTN|nr:glyoxalase [Nocardiopsis aegyptia]NYJ37808.1 putative glyoxalase superfamily protein PhnB [Nocardiopsis aegyptia]